jgi:DNA repair exonuclease SbcCD ATPase subunit
MRTVRELTEMLSDFSVNLQTCSNHGDGFVVVYDRLKVGNECPICDQIRQHLEDLDQATCEEESYRKDFVEASQALRETTEQLTELKKQITEQLTELKKQITEIEETAKWRNQTTQNN